jgi:hypothetical protein
MRVSCLLVASLVGLAPIAAHADGPVFVIQRGPGGIEIVRETLAEGEVRVFGRDVRAGTIDVVLPVGPGESANFVQASDADQIIVRFAGGRITAQVRRANGRTVDLPARDLEDLRRQDIRVSVTVGGGPRKAFVISGYDTVMPDTIGPALNLFAGQLPEAMMRAGAVIQTDTYPHDPAVRACGRAPLERSGYLFARGRRPDGAEAWFIVDLAASESMVARSFVPAGQAIEARSAVEHSASGTRRLPYSPGGATGTIATVAGGTVFPSLAFGELRLSNVDMTVLERMPEGFGRPVAGILGMDVLRGCGQLALDLPADTTRATLELSSAPAPGTPTAETRFSWVASHVVVLGTLDGARVRWILDSGAPRTVVDSVGAPPLRSAGGSRALRGLEGPGVHAARARATSLTLGADEHRDVACDVSPLPVFAAFREPGCALGVLGLSELARYRRLEVDFERRVVRWFR